jgi:hypothetical protein
MNSIRKTMGNQPLPAGSPRTWGMWWRGIRIPAIIFFVFALLALGLGYFQSTLVTGTELNTATWELRDFSFRRDPFSNIQLTGISRTASKQFDSWVSTAPAPTAKISPSIAKYLKARTNARWDLVRLGGSVSSTGGATILVDSLEARSQGGEFWPKWSSDHPNRANLLWPAVQDLVEFGLYAQLPKCLELAMIDSTLADFKHALEREVQSCLLVLCRRLKAQGHADDASIAARVGLNYGHSSELQAFCDARSTDSDPLE